MLLGTQRINAQGHLEIGGCDCTSLVSRFGTPLYVLDEAAFRANCREFQAAFRKRLDGSVEVLYASKALLTTAVARIVAQEGLGLDVASLGELHVALAAGFPPGRIAVHGSNKSRKELESAVAKQVGYVIVDNFHELEMLGDILAGRDGRSGAGIDVLLRVTPGVDPVTHRLIRTGQADTKFGFNISDGAAIEAVRRALATPGMRFRGLHCHIGSQLLDSDTHVESVEIMVRLMAAIRGETGAAVEKLNIGGGLGVRYLAEHRPPSYSDFAERITQGLHGALAAAGLPAPGLILEPGRALVAEAGTTLYSVGAIKTVPISDAPGKRTYVSIDGGMSDNPRPQLYDSVYECLLANRADQPATEVVSIAGMHCETDVLLWDARLPRPEPGDILAVQTTGAYNYSMSSNYNKALRPAMVLVADGSADVIVERESLDSLLAHDRVPDRLNVPFSL